MDRITQRLPDPVTASRPRERRRFVRQKLHTPVYASFNRPQTGMVLDLSELIDLNEEGFAVQTSERLEANSAVSICLDLPETKNFVHATGVVIWSDDSGRGGIRFSMLPESSRKALNEWLFANLLIAGSNHTARSRQLAQRETRESPEPDRLREPSFSLPVLEPQEDLPSFESVGHKLRELDSRSDEVLDLLTESARKMTDASGSALALLVGDKMVCCARAGEPAPPVGALVDISHGLSGECVRTGRIVSCEDMGNDPRVDPEIGRALGLGAFMAAPIFSDFKVIGLLEVFSPHTFRFKKEHGRILDRLGEMVPKHFLNKIQPEIESGSAESVTQAIGTDTVSGDVTLSPLRSASSLEQEAENVAVITPVNAPQALPQPLQAHVSALAVQPVSAPHSRLLYRALLGLVIAVVAMVIGYLVGPYFEKQWANSVPSSPNSAFNGVESASRGSARNHGLAGKPVPELQKLADRGDPDAQWQMAIRYHNGEGVLQDDTQAMKWFERAAEQGHVDAQSHLGAYYWAGRGVPEDLSKAYFWSSIAMAQGDEISKARLEGLASQMTREQVSQARLQAETWIRGHSAAKTSGN